MRKTRTDNRLSRFQDFWWELFIIALLFLQFKTPFSSHHWWCYVHHIMSSFRKGKITHFLLGICFLHLQLETKYFCSRTKILNHLDKSKIIVFAVNVAALACVCRVWWKGSPEAPVPPPGLGFSAAAPSCAPVFHWEISIVKKKTKESLAVIIFGLWLLFFKRCSYWCLRTRWCDPMMPLIKCDI